MSFRVVKGVFCACAATKGKLDVSFLSSPLPSRIRWGSEDQMDATGRSAGRPSSMVEPGVHKKRPASWVDSCQRKGLSLGEKVSCCMR